MPTIVIMILEAIWIYGSGYLTYLFINADFSVRVFLAVMTAIVAKRILQKIQNVSETEGKIDDLRGEYEENVANLESRISSLEFELSSLEDKITTLDEGNSDREDALAA